jgi:xylitol oxidase
MRTNWAGNLSYRASALRHARTVAEVQEIVRAADRLRVLGTRHSFNDIADTDGLQLSLEDLARVVRIDPERRRVTVDGGIRYGDLAPILHAEGWALANLASLPHISVAGAVATATHGSGSATGNLATQVAAVEIVTATGDLVTFSRERDSAAFAGAVVALGALGAVVSLTLDIEPACPIRQDVYTGLPHDVLAGDFESIFAAGTSVSVFTDWRGDTAGTVWVKDRVGGPEAALPRRGALFGAPAADRPLHPLPGGPAGNCTEQMGRPGPWHERLPHFRMDFTPSNGAEIQAEFFLPREEAIPAIASMRRHGERLAPVLLVSEIRTVAADDLWLSPSRGSPYFGIHFTFQRDWDAVRAVLPEIEADLGRRGAIPHWGKVTTMAPEAIAVRFPRLPEFRDLVDAHDPEGKFRNGFVDRILRATG